MFQGAANDSLTVMEIAHRNEAVLSLSEPLPFESGIGKPSRLTVKLASGAVKCILSTHFKKAAATCTAPQ
jgi:hypothetical protein